MNSTAALLVSSLSIGFGAVAAYFAFDRGPATSPVQGAEVERTAQADPALAGQVAELTSAVESLQASVQLIESGGARSAASVDEAMIARAVAAYLEGRGDELPTEDLAEGLAALGTPEEIAALLADADQVASTELWKRLVEEGKDKELLDHLKALAEANPNDPEAQLALGNAYLGRTQQSAGPMAGLYATLADEALNNALEADPEHWEARFTKAVALSFWPPNLGKQPEAISQFETLISKQAGVAAAPEHAQSHFFLGNLYQQNGQPEKALEAWRRGLEMFPDDQQLAAQVALMEGR